MSDISYALSAVAALSAGMGVLGWRRRHILSARAYLAFTAAILVWTLAYVWEIEATGFGAMVLAAKVQYLAAVSVPVAVMTTARGGRPCSSPRRNSASAS